MTARLAALALALLLPGSAAAAPVEEPPGYRMDNYRAPVPATLAGARVLDPEQAYALWLSGEAAFVDVLPQAPKPANLPPGTLWRDKPRHSVPGALWLPNVGYGAIAGATGAYFRAGLEKAAGGDKAHPLVIFCLEDCWMSWNAAKRAVEYGYSDVYWMPSGTDGWSFFDYPVEEIRPEPGF